MKKSAKGSIIVVILVAVGIIAFSMMKASQNVEEWLICDYPDKYKNYTEKLKFRFYLDYMIGYYREEELETTNPEKLEENYQYFLNNMEKIEESDTFSYEVEKDGQLIKIKTFIDVYDDPNTFDSYMEDLDLNSDDTLDMVRLELEGLDYSCKVVKKQV